MRESALVKMKILYIVETDPRLTGHGGQQRVHFIWKALKKLGDVYTVYPVAHREMEVRDDTDHIYATQLERRFSPTWFLKRMMKNWSNHITFPLYRTSARIWRWGIPIPDVCVVRPASLAYSLGLLDRFPVCVDMDDIPTAELEILERRMGRTVKRRISRMLLSRMEQRILCKARHVWIADEAELGRFPKGQVSFLPNIPVPPLPDFANELGQEDQLFFVGSLNSLPNIIALDWFLKKCWRVLKDKYPRMSLDVVGGGLPQKYGNEWAKYAGVRLLGRIDDLRPFYRRALAVVAPMQVGSGSCLKVLEALRMGRPLIATQQGLRGIRLEMRTAENGMFLFEDSQTLLCAIDNLLCADRLSIQRQAIAFVELRNNQAFIDATVAQDIKAVVNREGNQ